MKIISYLFIGLLFIDLLFGLTSSLSENRKINISKRSPYERIEGNNTVAVSQDGKNVTVKADEFYEFLFLNNKNASLLTAIVLIILCVMASLLLFGPDAIRIKIYQSHTIKYIAVLLIISVMVSWYFTTSFVNNIGNGLANYKYRINYSSVLWPFFIILFCLRILEKFKQKYNDYDIESI